MKQYDHKKIENKWQKAWKGKKVYKTEDSSKKPKFYVLDMFPYPSGEGLHVGHPKGYIATDIVSRMKRMQGFNVLHPMGFDAFGLPAENYAIKMKVNPAVAVAKNVARFKKQLEIIGFDYDWSREVNTTDPKFYRWTQWTFLKLLEKGLAYESFEPINWCPSCKTGLANEDVEDGKCERCGTPVEKKPMRQWVIRITDYADRLLKDIDTLDWPESIKESQRNWIGRSEGAEIDFAIKTKPSKVLLIHGFEGDADAGYKPWLKKELQNMGYEVRVPNLPDSYHPKYADIFKVLEKETMDFGENDIIVGHSMGGHFALRLAEKKRFKKVILTAPGIGGFGLPYAQWKKKYPESDYDSLKTTLEGHIPDFSKIKADEKIAIFGTDDPFVPLSHKDNLDSSWKVRTMDNVGHFEGEVYRQILNAVTGSLRIFTTRPDTLYGVTYMVVAPEHPFVTELLKHKENLKNHDDVVKYVAHARMMTQIERTDAKKEKTGVQLQGVSVINPANGQEVSVWVADYVLADYGTGAVMAVPAHDERDFAFAKKYNLPVKTVVEPIFVKYGGNDGVKEGQPFVDRNAVACIVKHWSENKYLVSKWKTNDWQGFVMGGIEGNENEGDAAVREVAEESGYLSAVYKETLGTVHSKFHHDVKSVNRFAHFKVVYLELKDGKRAPVSEEEKNLQEISWIDEKQVENFVNRPDVKQIWNLFALGKIYEGQGVLVDSGEFTGKDSVVSQRQITESVGGKWVVRYRLKDWVFSRQRYWGEPFPILHSSEYSDVSKNIKPKIEINFYHKDIWDALIAGTKTVETRALNPHEPHRLFADVMAGDYIAGVFKKTGEKKVFKVKSVYRWKNIGELWSDKPVHGKIFRKSYKSLSELTKAYGKLAPEYADKANKEGIAGWEVELVNVPVPVPEKDLPVVLPKVKSYEPTGTGESPLADISKWVNVKMGKKIMKRETNTMPQWAGSSWYYLRYMDPKNGKSLVDSKKEKYWNTVDFYVGGAEHATRHLIYARFWHKFLYDIGVVSTLEPFKKLQSVGLIMGEDGQKMSKRFGNVVNPDDIVAMYGADTLRIYEMFMGPFDQSIAWSTKGMVGSRRFIERVWKLREKVSEKGELPKHADILLNKTILKVSEDIASIHHNTAISSLMILSNELEACPALPREAYEALLKLLAPFAPHMAEELWTSLGNKKSIHVSNWPVADESKIAEELATIAVQVNGKTRATFQAPKTASQPELEKAALALDDVKKWLGGKSPTKVIVIPGRMVSIVVKI